MSDLRYGHKQKALFFWGSLCFTPTLNPQRLPAGPPCLLPHMPAPAPPPDLLWSPPHTHFHSTLAYKSSWQKDQFKAQMQGSWGLCQVSGSLRLR